MRVRRVVAAYTLVSSYGIVLQVVELAFAVAVLHVGVGGGAEAVVLGDPVDVADAEPARRPFGPTRRVGLVAVGWLEWQARGDRGVTPTSGQCSMRNARRTVAGCSPRNRDANERPSTKLGGRTPASRANVGAKSTLPTSAPDVVFGLHAGSAHEQRDAEVLVERRLLAGRQPVLAVVEAVVAT